MATPIPSNRAAFTLGEVAAACNGTLHGDASLSLVGVTTDSRAVVAGNLYIALRGERFDGHRFVPAARAAGAAAVLVSDARDLPAGTPHVVVADTLRALGDLAHVHRKRWGGRVLAITGSAGKTTTKELTFAALKAAGLRCASSPGNLNNLVGAPMCLLTLDREIELMVLELGTNASGEIARLAEIASPEVAMVTSVAAAHTEGLGSIERVAAEKASLLWAVPEHGVAIYNADNAPLCAELGRIRARRKLAFGRAPAADVRLVQSTLSEEPAMVCDVQLREPARTLRCALGLFGEGPALDATAALAGVLAVAGDAVLDAAIAGLSHVKPPPGRLSPRKGPAGSLVLDDSYNANPASMRASISAAIELARVRKGRAVLVLGDMLELGDSGRKEHEEVGRLAAQPGVAVFVACGTQMTNAAAAAREVPRQGVALSILHLADAEQAASLLEPLLGAGDVVLVKGSRSMAMERVVQGLTGEGTP